MESNDKNLVDCALTTTDNPFDPFTQFDKWFAFDEAKGYHSCSYLARIARTSDEFSAEDQQREIERAQNPFEKNLCLINDEFFDNLINEANSELNSLRESKQSLSQEATPVKTNVYIE